MRRYKKLISYLLLVLTINIYLMYNTLNNKDSPIGEIHLKDSINKLDSFAIMLEQNDGTYVESTSSTFPINYTLNLEKSKCIDKDGNILNNALSITKDIVEVKTTTTTYCYLYFDKIITAPGTIFEGVENISSELLGDMYRFVGTANEVDNNYICFGTTNKDTCINNPDKYMYRIIGINTNDEIKLIKKEALTTSYWQEDETLDIDAPSSYVIPYLNNVEFLENNIYVPGGWSNLIISKSQKYGDVYGRNIDTIQDMVESLKMFQNLSGDYWYNIENNLPKAINIKVSLINMYDYLYQYEEGLIECSSNNENCTNSWMHISNNDLNYALYDEWLFTSLGYGSGIKSHAAIANDGRVLINDHVNSKKVIRPVFYVNASRVLKNSGTLNDPYMLDGPITAVEYIKNTNSENISKTIEGGLYRYQGSSEEVNNNYICFGTADKDTCLNNSDKYMYRIIGINENNNIKLIKKEALGQMQWYTDDTTNITWPDSLIYQNINGEIFLTNSTYIDATWIEKIVITNWKYGDYKSNDMTAVELYEVENEFSSSINAKVGLIYPHDVYYAYQSGGLICTMDGEYDKCADSWLSLWNASNDVNWSNVTYEWTMSRYGYGGILSRNYRAWTITKSGNLGNPSIASNYLVRPVFYLDSKEIINEGVGTIIDPYILKE